jgi:hypothetical protein
VIRELVRPDEIHRDVYLDAELSDLEMEQLWHNTWIYVGHARPVFESSRKACGFGKAQCVCDLFDGQGRRRSILPVTFHRRIRVVSHHMDGSATACLYTTPSARDSPC